MSWFLLPSPKWPPRQLQTTVKTEGKSILSKALRSSVISKLKAEWAIGVRSKASGFHYNSDPRWDVELKLGAVPTGWGRRGGLLRGREGQSLPTNHVEEAHVNTLFYLYTSSHFILPMALGGKCYCYFTDDGTGREIKWLVKVTQ